MSADHQHASKLTNRWLLVGSHRQRAWRMGFLKHANLQKPQQDICTWRMDVGRLRILLRPHFFLLTLPHFLLTHPPLRLTQRWMPYLCCSLLTVRWLRLITILLPMTADLLTCLLMTRLHFSLVCPLSERTTWWYLPLTIVSTCIYTRLVVQLSPKLDFV